MTVTVVTGAESGIGRAVALECAARGHHVVLAGLQEAGIAETAQLIAASAGSAIAVPTDIRVTAQVTRLFDAAQENFGLVHGVVANAGIAHPPTPFFEQADDVVEAMLHTNAMGTFRILREAARRMIAQQAGGSIVLTGSSTALRPVPGLLPYAISKGAVHVMARAAAIELAPYGVRVNLLVPGTTATPLVLSIPGRERAAASETPLGEIVQPEELARAVAFLLGPDAPHMTGAQMIIDSGRTI